jgi:hypothetical protein
MYHPPKLPVPSVPYSEESIEGYVTRACYMNGFDRQGQLLGILGYQLNRRTWHTRLSQEHAVLLAEQFGCSADQLTGRFHSAANVPETAVVFEDFFGTPIRAFLRETVVRRLSPAALRQADYHRRLWSLRPFRYCAETGEKLIGACPRCDRNLGWFKTYGVGFCEYCGDEEGYSLVDLRQLERPRLTDRDLGPYRAAADLVLSPAQRSAIFPSYFDGWPSWELLDLILTLAAMLLRCHDLQKPIKRGQVYGLFGWHANFMSAIRIVSEWPGSAGGVVAEVLKVCATQTHEGRGYGGRGRIQLLGPFANPQFHAGTPRVAFEVRSAVERALPLSEDRVDRRSRPNYSLRSFPAGP